jgi:hypothetical protein
MEREREENIIILIVTVIVDVAFLVYEAVSNAFYIVLTCTMTDNLERTCMKAVVP